MNDMQSLSARVLHNPYLSSKIFKAVDIRSLFQCHSLSKDIFDAVDIECEKRKELIHLYLLRYDINTPVGRTGKDSLRLVESFIHFTKIWLNMRPKHVLIFIGGYRHSMDYRERRNSLTHMCQYLPKDCEITYLDVGPSILTSSIRFKSLTNYSEETSLIQTFQRTSFPCMSSLLIPELEGIEVKSYEDISEVQTNDLKAILFFQTTKPVKSLTTERQLRNAIHRLIERLDYNVAFGGGAVNATKIVNNCLAEEDSLRKGSVITFGGHRVQSGSYVINTIYPTTYLSQLEDFRNRLGFDCTDWQNSMSIAFVFANVRNFSTNFTADFQSVFPFVGIFGFQTKDKMFGKHFTNDKNYLNKVCESLNPRRSSVIVIVNMKYRRPDMSSNN